ncbi:MAG: hypothetical protein U1E65_06850 [Myxococcota bacterium]
MRALLGAGLVACLILACATAPEPRAERGAAAPRRYSELIRTMKNPRFYDCYARTERDTGCAPTILFERGGSIFEFCLGWAQSTTATSAFSATKRRWMEEQTSARFYCSEEQGPI